jgi:hypothetical protein
VSGAVVFRITYARYGELRDDVAGQMARGGLLVKIHDDADLTLDTPVQLELVLPDGSSLHGAVKVLHVLPGFGVAVSVDAELVERSRRAAAGLDAPGGGPARHERIGPVRTRPPTLIPREPARARPPTLAPPGPARARPPTLTPPEPARARPATLTPPPGGSPPAMPPPSIRGSSPAIPVSPQPGSRPPTSPDAAESPSGAAPRPEGPTRPEKVQLALHGSRDERNAILRDRDRTLHPFVLKNPQLDADDVLAIAKNAQMTADLLGLIGERKDWIQRPAIALALARNPRTPPQLAVRVLDHVSTEALRQIAKGTGVPPHVTQAARKKLLG